MEGFYCGSDVTSIKFNPFNPSECSGLVFASPGRGMHFAMKRIIMEQVIEQKIVNNHLNSNNWLKKHGKPMVRKGHPFYDRCKELKGRKPFKILVIDPHGEEYRSLNTYIHENIPGADIEYVTDGSVDLKDVLQDSKDIKVFKVYGNLSCPDGCSR